MKQLLFLFLAVSFLTPSIAQSIKPGAKAAGGIVFDVKNKKHGLVVAEKDLGLMTWSDGKKACEDLVINGYSDWRLPTKDDLASIYYAVYVTKLGDYHTGYYWSGTENKGIRELAWCFDFNTGEDFNNHSKTNAKYILAVRSY